VDSGRDSVDSGRDYVTYRTYERDASLLSEHILTNLADELRVQL